MEESRTMKRLAMGVGIATGLVATLLGEPVAYAGSATAPPAIVARAPV